MGDDEWRGLLASLNRGGVLQVEEDKGFRRALAERKSTPPPAPDYGDDLAQSAETSAEAAKRLTALVLRMAQLELEEGDLEYKLKETQKELRQYRENLVPELMAELGSTLFRTALGGIEVEMKEELRASFPKDTTRQIQCFAWLKETGNDGIIKREVTIQYGRDSIKWADELVQKLEEWGIGEHGTLSQEWNINHQTLLAFLRRELKDGKNVPMEVFSAFVQRYAKIKRGK